MPIMSEYEQRLFFDICNRLYIHNNRKKTKIRLAFLKQDLDITIEEPSNRPTQRGGLTFNSIIIDDPIGT